VKTVSFSLGVIPLSIRSVDDLAPAFSATPLTIDNHEHRPGPATLSGLSYLTSGDRDLVVAMFGWQTLAMIHNPNGSPAEAARFIALLVNDRRSGGLPVGVEVTGRYLQAVWDQYPSYAGRGSVVRLLTRKNLVDGLFFLSRRD
jgi:hypothetical protein